jgi:serine protease inhibitor ecotin
MPHGKQQAKTCTTLLAETLKMVTPAKVLVLVLVPDKAQVQATKYKTWILKK